VIQNKKYRVFYGGYLLKQWNAYSGHKKDMADFIDNKQTWELIDVPNKE